MRNQVKDFLVADQMNLGFVPLLNLLAILHEHYINHS
jgi:hypothetical protein